MADQQTRRKLLALYLAIGVAAAVCVAGFGTWAAYSDAETGYVSMGAGKWAGNQATTTTVGSAGNTDTTTTVRTTTAAGNQPTKTTPVTVTVTNATDTPVAASTREN